jgi:hypothetical protein
MPELSALTDEAIEYVSGYRGESASVEARGLCGGLRRILRIQRLRHDVDRSIAASRTHPDHSARLASEIVHLRGLADDDRVRVGGAMGARGRQCGHSRRRARWSLHHAASDFSDGSFDSRCRSVHSCWQKQQRKITVVAFLAAITPTAAPTPVRQLGHGGVSWGNLSITADLRLAVRGTRQQLRVELCSVKRIDGRRASGPLSGTF